MTRFKNPYGLTPLALAAVLLLSGCASFSQDGGMQTVSALADARTGAPAALADKGGEDKLTQLLAQPLDADSAVRIALMNNHGMKGRWPNWARPNRTSCKRGACASRPVVRPLARQPRQ